MVNLKHLFRRLLRKTSAESLSKHPSQIICTLPDPCGWFLSLHLPGEEVGWLMVINNCR